MTKEEIDDYLAGIHRTVSESEALLQRARLCLDETDRLLESQGLTREQVMGFKISDEQREEVDAYLRRLGFPPLSEVVGPSCADEARVDYESPDTQGDLSNRERRFGDMMNAFRL